MISERDVAAFLRFQPVLRAALERLGRLRFAAGEIDQYFCTAVRDAMLAVGASDEDIHRAAALMVRLIVQGTKPGSEGRQELLELVAEHVACSDMEIRVNESSGSVQVAVLGSEQGH